jgi:hypothetical protein
MCSTGCVIGGEFLSQDAAVAAGGSGAYFTAPNLVYKSNGAFFGRISSGGICLYGGTAASINGVITCTNAPSCTAPQTRNAAGVCEAPPDVCRTKPNYGQLTTAWFTSTTADLSGIYCSSGCRSTVSLDSTTTTEYFTDTTHTKHYNVMMNDGTTCTTGAAAPTTGGAPSPPDTPKQPPCAASDGVMTTTSGKIHCVPEGTPSSAKPTVSQSSSTSTAPDGSKKVDTTTTTTDPQTGAKSSSTTTTISAGPGGGTAAGTPGTSTTASGGGITQQGTPNPNNQEKTGFCADNPNLQICKGGLNEEATQKKISDSISKIADSLNPGDTNYDAVKNAKESADATKQLDDANKTLTDAVSGVTSAGDANKSAWAQAMSTDWFAGIPASSCSPVDGQIGGRSFHLDYCPTAQKISTIAEYAMWFMFVVSTFVFLTGGRKEG